VGDQPFSRLGLELIPDRRFPPPWTFEEANNACFAVKNAKRLAVAFFLGAKRDGALSPTYDEGRSSADRSQYREAARSAWRRAEAGCKRAYSQEISEAR
jgi:hypothetical protein